MSDKVANMSRLLLGLLVFGLAAPAVAADPEGVVVMVFARKGADVNTAVRIERDLRNMFDFAHGEGMKGTEDVLIPATRPVELRFDVGHLSKGDIEKARMQFNEAQRRLEKEEPEEAMENLFRAERFYNKGIPYASDPGLLRGIFYYYYLAREASGLKDEAVDAYCAYVALTRNLAGSVGPIEQFEPLADKCGGTSISGTAELRVASNVDGAHVYIDERAVGVIGTKKPYANPFASAGPHLVEVRKAGYARWGTLVTLRKGKTESLRAKLKKARNLKDEYTPLFELPFEGEDAFSEVYLADLMFQMAERYGVAELIVGYLEPVAGKNRLVLLSFNETGVDRTDSQFGAELDGHRPSLMEFWKARYGADLDPADALPALDRWAPTLFKVE